MAALPGSKNRNKEQKKQRDNSKHSNKSFRNLMRGKSTQNDQMTQNQSLNVDAQSKDLTKSQNQSGSSFKNFVKQGSSKFSSLRLFRNQDTNDEKKGTNNQDMDLLDMPVLAVDNLTIRKKDPNADAKQTINELITLYQSIDPKNQVDYAYTTLASIRKKVYRIYNKVMNSGKSDKKTKSDKKEIENILQAIETENGRLNILRKDMILRDYKIDTPKVVFRYDSRPIEVALKNGYVATNPDIANINKDGGNQEMVGGAHNFVGSMNYRGFAMQYTSNQTEQKWDKDQGRTLYWTAAVARTGGMTYEWLLKKIPDKKDQQKARDLILTRREGDKKSDAELQKILTKYDIPNNVGTTEIVTEKIAGEDILGYWEMFEPILGKHSGKIKRLRFISRMDDNELNNQDDKTDESVPQGFKVRMEINGDERPRQQDLDRLVQNMNINLGNDIPQEDKQRYVDFIKTGGSVKKSNII